MKLVLNQIGPNLNSKSAFDDPSHTKNYGYNSQIIYNLHHVISFNKVAPGVFPGTPDEIEWVEKQTLELQEKVKKIADAGLQVIAAVNLLEMPERLWEFYADDFKNEGGTFSLQSPKTLELYQSLFEEILKKFPEVSGVLIDLSPNTSQYSDYHRRISSNIHHPECQLGFLQKEIVTVLEALCDLICKEQDKALIFRTTSIHLLHTDPDFYHATTHRLEKNPNLYFSFSHSTTGFDRWSEFNPCLTQGEHQQIIEVQCKREFEGKGAYPNYPIKYVFDGFPEMKFAKGIKMIGHHSNIEGILAISGGSGNFGPELKNELWPDLSAYLIGQYGQNPELTESKIFNTYSKEILNLSDDDIIIFREIALLSESPILKMVYCSIYDRSRETHQNATNHWKREDRLGGLPELMPVFDHIIEQGAIEAALAEKREAIQLWEKLLSLTEQLECKNNPELLAYLKTSIQYGIHLSEIIDKGWNIILRAYARRWKEHVETHQQGQHLEDFDQAWEALQKLSEQENCATAFSGKAWSPNGTEIPGMEDEISKHRFEDSLE